MNNLVLSLFILPINREYSATSFSTTNISTCLELFHSELGKMGSKAMLVLVMFLASALILSAEVAPKNLDENFDAKHGISFHEKFSLVFVISCTFNSDTCWCFFQVNMLINLTKFNQALGC